MPHPTPYSRQFDSIRAAYPRLFEGPGSESRSHPSAGSGEATTNENGHGCDQAKPNAK
jgi:hypothetical protein